MAKIDMYLVEEIRADEEVFNWESWQWEVVESPTSQNHFVNALSGATAQDEVHLYINSLGGSVKEALGIYNFLQRSPARVVAHIDGFAASAASIIAMAADSVIMPANTCMMIHNASWWAYGNPAQLRKSAEDLEVINSAAIASYQMHAGEKLDEVTLRRFLDAESWLTAQQCLDLGLCDELIERNGDANYAVQQYAAASAKMVHMPAAKLPQTVAALLSVKGTGNREQGTGSLDDGAQGQDGVQAAAADALQSPAGDSSPRGAGMPPQAAAAASSPTGGAMGAAEDDAGPIRPCGATFPEGEGNDENHTAQADDNKNGVVMAMLKSFMEDI